MLASFAAKRLGIIIATYNIRNTQDRYLERKELLKQTINSQNADIICLQEVSFYGTSQLTEIFNANSKKESAFEEYNAPSQLKFHERIGADPESKLDGNSIVVSKTFLATSQLRVVRDEHIHLSGYRVAQALKFEGAENSHMRTPFWIVNTHLHHVIQDAIIRHHQLEHLLQWITKITENDNVFICGDFNLTPQEFTYDYICEAGFTSMHQLIHGKEPAFTFPTGIQAPHMDTDPEGCFDYIWFKGSHIQAKTIEVFGNVSLEKDSTIYPSDHYGIRAHVEITEE